MSIVGLHIPHDGSAMAPVVVDERNAVSFYPFVGGGPVEAGRLLVMDHTVAVYVNSRYSTLSEFATNVRATAFFELGNLPMFGGAIRGDALMVLGADEEGYDRSLPSDLMTALLALNDDEA